MSVAPVSLGPFRHLRTLTPKASLWPAMARVRCWSRTSSGLNSRTADASIRVYSLPVGRRMPARVVSAIQELAGKLRLVQQAYHRAEVLPRLEQRPTTQLAEPRALRRLRPWHPMQPAGILQPVVPAQTPAPPCSQLRAVAPVARQVPRCCGQGAVRARLQQ